MKNLHIIILACIVATLAACTEDLPIDAAPTTGILCLNGYLYSDCDTNLLYVTTTGVSSPKNVKDATVRMFVNGTLAETQQAYASALAELAIVQRDYDILTAIPLSTATVSGIKTKVYTGEAVEQPVVVKVDGKTLQQDLDYTLAYENNVEAGKGKALKVFKVNAKNGAITVAKGTKVGTYKVKVKARAKGDSNYKATTKRATVRIRVK